MKPAVPQLDTSNVEALFSHAVNLGKKKPEFRFGDEFIISRAPDSGANPGAIYLKHGDEYLGKIVAKRFHPRPDFRAEYAEAINEAMKNPLSAAVAYGRSTGKCSICGAKLTNPESVKFGIGPICRDNFGL